MRIMLVREEQGGLRLLQLCEGEFLVDALGYGRVNKADSRTHSFSSPPIHRCFLPPLYALTHSLLRFPPSNHSLSPLPSPPPPFITSHRIVERERRRDSFGSYTSIVNLNGTAGHPNFGSVESTRVAIPNNGNSNRHETDERAPLLGNGGRSLTGTSAVTVTARDYAPRVSNRGNGHGDGHDEDRGDGGGDGGEHGGSYESYGSRGTGES